MVMMESTVEKNFVHVCCIATDVVSAMTQHPGRNTVKMGNSAIFRLKFKSKYRRINHYHTIFWHTCYHSESFSKDVNK